MLCICFTLNDTVFGGSLSVISLLDLKTRSVKPRMMSRLGLNGFSLPIVLLYDLSGLYCRIFHNVLLFFILPIDNTSKHSFFSGISIKLLFIQLTWSPFSKYSTIIQVEFIRRRRTDWLWEFNQVYVDRLGRIFTRVSDQLRIFLTSAPFRCSSNKYFYAYIFITAETIVFFSDEFRPGPVLL